MNTTEFFTGLEMMGPIFGGVGEGSLEIYENPQGSNGTMFEICFQKKQPDDDNDTTKLVVTGEASNDTMLSFNGTLISSIVAIRAAFGRYIGDFSYTKMIMKNGPFMHARSQLQDALNKYRSLRDAGNAYRRTLVGILTNSSAAPQLGTKWFDDLGAIVYPTAAAFRKAEDTMANIIAPPTITSDAASFLHGMTVPQASNLDKSKTASCHAHLKELE